MRNNINISSANIVSWSTFSLLGKLVPPLIGLLVLPVIVSSLNSEAFAEFGFVMSLLVALSIFDLGITKGLVRAVAADDPRVIDERNSLNSVFWASFICQILVGCLVNIVLFFTLNIFFDDKKFNLFDTSSLVQQLILIIALPLILASGACRGFLEGQGKFKDVNVVKSIFSVVLYLSPVMLINFGLINWIVSLILMIKLLEGIVLVLLVVLKNNFLFIPRYLYRYLAPILHFGLWVMLASFFTPILVYGERFIILGSSTAEDFGAYFIAIELANKSLIFAGAIATAMFTLQSKLKSQSTSSHFIDLIRDSCSYVYAIGAAIIILEGQTFLRLWLGPAYDVDTYYFWSYLSIGAIFNAAGFSLLNAAYAEEKSKLVACIYGLQIIPYFSVMLILNSMYGVQGIVVTVILRQIIDFILLWLVSSGAFSFQVGKKLISFFSKVLMVFFTSLTFIFSLNHLMENFIIRLTCIVILSCVFFYYFFKGRFQVA